MMHAVVASILLLLPAFAQSQTCTFVDTNSNLGVVTGNVVCSVSSTENFLVVFQSLDNAYSANDVNLGASQMNKTGTVSVAVTDLLLSNGGFLLGAYYNTSAGANVFRTVVPISVVDAYYDTAPAAPTEPISFVDSNGAGDVISGTLKFNSPSDATAVTFDVYISQGIGRKATKLLLGSVTSLGVSTGHTYTVSNLALYNGGRAYSHFWIASKTASRIVNGVEYGLVNSTSALRLKIVDRDDSYVVLTNIEELTDRCSTPASGSCTCDKTYGVCMSFNSDGTMSFSWRTANLAQQRYIDGTFVDVSSSLFYNVGLGNCSYINQTAKWPSGSPSTGFTFSNAGEVTTFTITGTFSEFQACGFVRSDDTSIFSAKGTMFLEVWSNTTPAATAASLTIYQYLSLRFDDTITNVVAGFVENVEIINPTRAGLSANIQVMSTLNFYEMGFLSQKSSFVYGLNYDSIMNVEHSLVSNQDQFYLKLDRVWFTLSSSTFLDVLYEVPSTDGAFTNFDSPSHLGRYRFQMGVPFVMNCRPCYMHVSSLLKTTQPSNKALSAQPSSPRLEAPYSKHSHPKETLSSHVLVIDQAEKSSGDSAGRATTIAGIVSSMIMARMIH